MATCQTSVGMFVAKPSLNLEGHATAIQLWKACLVETWHLASSASSGSSLHPSFLPQTPPVPLEPLSPSYETTLSKACRAHAVLTVCSRQLWMICSWRVGRKDSKRSITKPKAYAGQWRDIREAYPEMLCGCTLVNRSFCLVDCPHVTSLSIPDHKKHNR